MNDHEIRNITHKSVGVMHFGIPLHACATNGCAAAANGRALCDVHPAARHHVRTCLGSRLLFTAGHGPSACGRAGLRAQHC
eukprot:scaffold158508_cov38-Prasinocladus_malaysianus.AAC.1